MKQSLLRLCSILLLLSSFLGHGSALPASVNAQDVPADCSDILNISVDGNKVARVADDYYRGQGIMAISINSTVSTYKVTSAEGECIGTPNPCGDQTVLSFDTDAAGNASSEVDMDAIPPIENPYRVTYRLTGEAAIYNDKGNKTGSTTFERSLYLTKNRLIGFDDVSVPMVHFSVFQPAYLDGESTCIPLVGETVTPSSSEFEFLPTTTTTDKDGRAYFCMIPVADAAGQLVSSETEDYFSGQVSVDVAGKQKETFGAKVAFARVSCIRGTVFKKDSWGATTRLFMDDKLLPGDIVILMGAQNDEQGNPIYPLICLDFYNGQRHIAESAFAKEGSYVNIQIGPEGVSGIFEESWRIDVRNMKRDLQDNGKEYLKLAVYHVMARPVCCPTQMGLDGFVCSQERHRGWPEE